MSRYYSDREKDAIAAIRREVIRYGLPTLVEFLNGRNWAEPEPGKAYSATERQALADRRADLDELRELLRLDVRNIQNGQPTPSSFGLDITFRYRCERDRRGRVIVRQDVVGGDADLHYWYLYEAIRIGAFERIVYCPQCGRFALKGRRRRSKYCSKHCTDAAARTNTRERQRRYAATLDAAPARGRRRINPLRR